MSKEYFDVFDHAGTICKAMQSGILLTTKVDGKVNTMTIGWGMIGIEWKKPIFIAFVREGRYTRQLLDTGMAFTVNVPYGQYDKNVLAYCGTKSGQHTDKIQDMNLTLEPSEHIDVPGIKEFPLTLECKLLYRQPQDLSAIPADILQKYYPADVDSTAPGSNSDLHIAYYAEIVGSYIIR